MKVTLRRKWRFKKYVAEAVIITDPKRRDYTLLIFKLDNGYRITPYEFKKYWKHHYIVEAVQLGMKLLYRPHNLDYLLYDKNPFLELVNIKPKHEPIPIFIKIGESE